MAITFETGLTNIDTAEAVGSWLGFRHAGGGSPSPAVDNDVQIQGNGCLALKISGTPRDEGMWWDFGAGSEVDFTQTANKHFYGWILITTLGLMNTIENGGCYVIAGTTLSNWSKWYVGGSDTFTGAWERIIIDLTKQPAETAATAATISSIRYVGFGYKGSGAAKQDNFFVDRCDYGQGIFQVFANADGDPDVNWETLRAEDVDNTSNKYGLIEETSGKLFLSGGIRIGAQGQSGPTTWNDATGTVATFKRRLYNDGTSPGLVDAVDYNALYSIDAQGSQDSPGEPTSITFGSVVGTGDDRQGVQGGAIEGEDSEVPFTVDFETDIADLSAVNLYGVGLKFADVTQFSGSTKTNLIGCIWETCGEIQPNDAVMLNCTLIAPKDRGVEMLSTHNMKQLTFVASGDANTEHHVHFIEGITQAIDFDAMQFFGFGEVGSPNNKWHGIISAGGNVTVTNSNSSNAAEGEFEVLGGSPTGSITVINNPVTTLVKVLDGRDNSNLQNARVILEASSGTGDLPFEDSVTIIQSAGTATVTHTGHGLATGNKVAISGATNDVDYNGAKTITVTGVNSYTYSVDSGAPSPATGTIIATGIVLEGLTDANGEISDTRAWTLAQPVIGVARKGTSAPFFKDGNLVGTISTTAGLSLTQALTFDGSNTSAS